MELDSICGFWGFLWAFGIQNFLVTCLFPTLEQIGWLGLWDHYGSKDQIEEKTAKLKAYLVKIFLLPLFQLVSIKCKFDHECAFVLYLKLLGFLDVASWNISNGLSIYFTIVYWWWGKSLLWIIIHTCLYILTTLHMFVKNSNAVHFSQYML